MYQPITGTGAGSAPVVNLTWPFLDQSHVQATVDGAPAALTWTGGSQVTFASPVPDGSAWAVFRDTPADSPLVTFTDGAILTAETLRLAQDQALYRLQELQQPTVGGETLAATSGAGLIGWIASGIGAITRLVQDKLRERVSVADFGAIGDGVTDDTAAIQAAIDSIGPRGGTVYVPPLLACVVDGDLTLQPNVTLKGAFGKVGSPKDNTYYPYDQLGGLRLNSSATITGQGGSGIDGLLIQRKGITYPADPALFAGTAITVGGDDFFVTNSMILGFAQAVSGDGYQRTTIEDVHADNTAGVLIQNAFDIPRIRGFHAWPFTTVGGALASAHRSGAAIRLVNADWAKITDSFAYGHQTGLALDGADDVVVVGLAIDGTQLYAGSKGVSIVNDALRARFLGLNVSSQETNFYLNATPSAINNAEIVGSSLVTATGDLILVDGGDLAVSTSTLMDAPYGVRGTDTASRLSVDQVRFSEITTKPIQATGNPNVQIGRNDYGDFAGASPIDIAAPSVASAATVVLPQNAEMVTISGAVGISGLNYGWSGRRITLVFTGALTLTHGTGSASSLFLKGSSNLSVTAGMAVSFIHDGTQWRQLQ